MIADNGESENEKTRQRDISVTMKITILLVLHGEGGTRLQHEALPRGEIQ